MYPSMRLYALRCIINDGDERMASVRLRGVCARVDDKHIMQKVRLIRKLIGQEFRIIIEKDRICVEGNIQDHDLRKKIDKILAS